MRKLTVTIHNDPDTECPCDWECQWRLVSFNDRHVNCEDPYKYLTPTSDGAEGATIGMRSKLKAGTAFIVSCYEHGDSVWSLYGEGYQCQWDTTRVAGILLWEHPPSHMGAKTYDERAKDASGFLETYTEWANGDTYYYSIDDEDGDCVGSCGGFIGVDTVVEAIQEQLEPDDEITVEGEAVWINDYHDLLPTKEEMAR